MAQHLVDTVLAGAQVGRCVETLAAWITSIACVDLVSLLLAGELDLGCVDDDDVVTAVGIRCEAGLVLATEQLSADFFINSVKLDSGDLPPVLDIEKRGKDENQLRRDLKLWLDKIEQHYKVKPILYTSYKFKTRYLNDSVFNSYPYWIAHYYVDSVEYRGEWKFWQHTDVGTLPGIREKVDLNIFNGSLEELQLMTIKK